MKLFFKSTTIAITNKKITTTLELWITKNTSYVFPDWLVKLLALNLFMKITPSNLIGPRNLGYYDPLDDYPVVDHIAKNIFAAIAKSQSLIYTTYQLIRMPLDLIFTSNMAKIIEFNGIKFSNSLYQVATDPILAPVTIASFGYYAWLKYTEKPKNDVESDQTEHTAYILS